jgi:hypothetical protein
LGESNLRQFYREQWQHQRHDYDTEHYDPVDGMKSPFTQDKLKKEVQNGGGNGYTQQVKKEYFHILNVLEVINYLFD